MIREYWQALAKVFEGLMILFLSLVAVTIFAGWIFATIEMFQDSWLYGVLLGLVPLGILAAAAFYGWWRDDY